MMAQKTKMGREERTSTTMNIGKLVLPVRENDIREATGNCTQDLSQPGGG